MIDVVYIESQAGDLFLESETDLSRFSIFEHLRAGRTELPRF